MVSILPGAAPVRQARQQAAIAMKHGAGGVILAA
jgi:hypothetical protein